MERKYIFSLCWLILFVFVGVLRSAPVAVIIPTFCEEIPEEFDINIEKSVRSEFQISISFCNFEKNHDYYLISAKTGRLLTNFQTNESSYIFFTNYEETEIYGADFFRSFMKFYLWDASINQTVKTIYVEK